MKELPYDRDEGPALRVLAARVLEHRSAEYETWHAAADIVKEADGTWSVRVRDLFHGNAWCGWRRIRTPKRTVPGDGWTYPDLACARRCLRERCS